MSGGAWVALGALAVLAPADWIAVGRGDRRLEHVAKPAATAALVAVALTLDPSDGTQRAWFVVALVLSLVGDVLLMLPRDVFVGGLASFLLAHLAYVAGFAAAGLAGDRLAVATLVTVAVLATVATPLLRGLRAGPERRLTAPVVAYTIVIGAMLAAALASGSAVAAAGAALFTGSDTLIAWNRFLRSLAWAPVAIMVTYHLGQLGLVLSLLG